MSEPMGSSTSSSKVGDRQTLAQLIRETAHNHVKDLNLQCAFSSIFSFLLIARSVRFIATHSLSRGSLHGKRALGCLNGKIKYFGEISLHNSNTNESVGPPLGIIFFLVFLHIAILDSVLQTCLQCIGYFNNILF